MSAHSSSSISNKSSVAQRKLQEEKNAKTLRELLAVPANKYCFECGQRGPTYANTTHSSFCCMHCSGLLRGLNPPQRVKSISMAIFTNDDIQKLQTIGNEENAKTWLGLYDKKIKFEPRVDDEIRHHLIQKYENKKWYVSPDDLAQQKKLLDEHVAQHKTLLTGSQRRDSVSSFSSHQSAPANLHPKKVDFFDLCTGDLPPIFTSKSATPQPPSAQVSHQSAAPRNSFVQRSLRYRVPHQQPFTSTDPIPANQISCGTSQAFSSSSFDSSFAEFDSQFNLLKNKNTTSAKPVEPTSISFSHSVPLALQKSPAHLPTNSKFADAQPNDFLQTKNSNVAWPTSFLPDLQKTGPNFQPKKNIGVTKDGRPIMSVPTSLPDYSALEELFRGSSSHTAYPSLRAVPPPISQEFPTSTLPNIKKNFNKLTSEDPFGLNNFSATPIAKSSTLGGLTDYLLPQAKISTYYDASAKNQLYSKSNFSPVFSQAQNVPQNVSQSYPLCDAFTQQQNALDPSTSSVSNGIYQSNDQSNADSSSPFSASVKNWNPFAS